MSFERQGAVTQEQILENSKKLRRQASVERSRLIARRTANLEHARRTIAEVQMNILAKHDQIRAGLAQERVRKETIIRVNRGLEYLEKLIPALRQINLNDEYLARAVRDPSVRN